MAENAEASAKVRKVVAHIDLYVGTEKVGQVEKDVTPDRLRDFVVGEGNLDDVKQVLQEVRQ